MTVMQKPFKAVSALGTTMQKAAASKPVVDPMLQTMQPKQVKSNFSAALSQSLRNINLKTNSQELEDGPHEV